MEEVCNTSDLFVFWHSALSDHPEVKIYGTDYPTPDGRELGEHAWQWHQLYPPGYPDFLIEKQTRFNQLQ